MRCMLAIVALTFGLLGCATTPPEESLHASQMEFFDHPGDNPREIIVGVMCCDRELGRAEFTLTATWLDGRSRVLLGRYKLKDWSLPDFKDNPPAYVSIRGWVGDLPARLEVEDHLRQRRAHIEVGVGQQVPGIAFFLLENGIGHRARRANGDQTGHWPD